MAIRAMAGVERYGATNPDSVDASMTLTMTVSEWRVLVSDLPNSYPNWKAVNSIIADVLSPVTGKAT